ncbi:MULTISPECIES: hypothetical protein [unclassified Amycolatopsis]|uniref:hypothetical protein n=1 Tax=unclassified Amycolatopsis TaxID=2618356 RepID=UPI002104F055|nr:hypothetical protein [Amycolatopsis sp. DSM 110486]
MGAILVLGGALVLTSCAASANPDAGTAAPGFWLGIWHGLICPITFLISLFNDDVGIYEVNNNGHLYDFGFVFGIVLGATIARGPAYAQRRNRKEN